MGEHVPPICRLDGDGTSPLGGQTYDDISGSHKDPVRSRLFFEGTAARRKSIQVQLDRAVGPHRVHVVPHLHLELVGPVDTLEDVDKPPRVLDELGVYLLHMHREGRVGSGSWRRVGACRKGVVIDVSVGC
jgi:hypothetical protein